MTWSPTLRPVTPSPTAVIDAGALVAEQRREHPRDRPVLDGKVGVADARGGGLDLDLAGTRLPDL